MNEFAPKLRWLGIGSAVLMIIASCFLPWSYYADLNEYFTGFYSKNGQYGQRGKWITILLVVYILLQLAPYVWAKVVNLFTTGLAITYIIAAVSTFSSDHGKFQIGMWILIILSPVVLLSVIFPHLVLKPKKN